MKTAVEKLYDELERRCDLSRYWNDPGFHCFRQLPLEVRAWPITQAIESQIENGGLAQLLWNTFPNWRELIDGGIEAYRWMGLSQQADALTEIREIFARHETECGQFVRRAASTQSIQEMRSWLTQVPAEFETYPGITLFQSDELTGRKEGLLKREIKGILRSLQRLPRIH